MVRKYLIMAIFTSLVFFFVGLIIGNALNSFSYAGKVESLLRQNEYNLDNYLLEKELFKTYENENCDLFKSKINTLSSDLYTMGKFLTEEEKNPKLNPDDYKYIKTKYHLTQIRTYLIYYELIERCSLKDNIILYYYDYNNESEQQGKILDKLAAENNIKVFAIKLGYDSSIKFLETYYKIDSAPSLIINHNCILKGFSEEEAINKCLLK